VGGIFEDRPPQSSRRHRGTTCAIKTVLRRDDASEGLDLTVA
jgi:hypothetical protein